MLVYRKISNAELESYLLNDINYQNKKVTGENTFKYNLEKEYIHFYKYFLDACHFGYEHQYIMIADIPSDILKSRIGVGSYLMTRDRIEYAIEKEIFDKSYIVDFCKLDNSNKAKIDSYNNREEYLTSIKENEVEKIKTLLKA